jgi:predicted Rossmann fold nucleotide-binding protein DprA/Smf involved in DNA uptake
LSPPATDGETVQGPNRDFTEVARKVLLTMSRQQIPLTPDNYQVWFAYVIGCRPELTKEIDELIAEGAKLVTKVEDIISEFPDLAALTSPSARGTPKEAVTLSAEERRVYDLIGLEPLHIDDIISQVGLSPTRAAQILLTLQMQGLIEQVEGRRYIRSP